MRDLYLEARIRALNLGTSETFLGCVGLVLFVLVMTALACG